METTEVQEMCQHPQELAEVQEQYQGHLIQLAEVLLREVHLAEVQEVLVHQVDVDNIKKQKTKLL